MKHKAHAELVVRMKAEARDFTLQEIYELVCQPPHIKNLEVSKLHRRISRAIGEARAALKREGYLLVLGDLRHSYKAIKRTRR
jgi:hypothetical protein